MATLEDEFCAQVQNACTSIDVLLRCLTELRVVRTAAGLRVMTEGGWYDVDLAPDDAITEVQQRLNAESGRVDIVVKVATAWESFQHHLGWYRKGERALHLRLNDVGLSVRQDGEWYSMEGLLSKHVAPEEEPRKRPFLNFVGDDAKLDYDSPVEADADVMTRDEYLNCVTSGGFIDYDGFGHPVRDGRHSEVVVKPSLGADCIPDDATHVVWYNR